MVHVACGDGFGLASIARRVPVVGGFGEHSHVNGKATRVGCSTAQL